MVLFVAFLLVVVCLSAYQHLFVRPGQIRDYRQEWQDVADRLGLTAALPDKFLHWSLRGAVSGNRLEVVHQDGGDGTDYALLEMWYPPRLEGLACFRWSTVKNFIGSLCERQLAASRIPLGIPDLDRNYRVQSTAPTLLQALFRDAAVVSGFGLIRGRKAERITWGASTIRRRILVHYIPSVSWDDLEECIRETAAIIDLLADALDRFSDTLASRTQLTIVPEVARNLPRFEGTRDGVHIDLRQPATGDGLQLTATPATPVEPTLTIVAQQADNASLTGARVPMLDPILDAHVHVSTKQPEATRALLTQDQTREDILALMMAHPNARVHHGTVTLLVPTVDPDTVAAALDDVAALAASLSTPRAGEVSRAGAAAVAKVVR